jgi:hypothetical protein
LSWHRSSRYVRTLKVIGAAQRTAAVAATALAEVQRNLGIVEHSSIYAGRGAAAAVGKEPARLDDAAAAAADALPCSARNSPRWVPPA